MIFTGSLDITSEEDGLDRDQSRAPPRRTQPRPVGARRVRISKRRTAVARGAQLTQFALTALPCGLLRGIAATSCEIHSARDWVKQAKYKTSLGIIPKRVCHWRVAFAADSYTNFPTGGHAVTLDFSGAHACGLSKRGVGFQALSSQPSALKSRLCTPHVHLYSSCPFAQSRRRFHRATFRRGPSTWTQDRAPSRRRVELGRSSALCGHEE